MDFGTLWNDAVGLAGKALDVKIAKAQNPLGEADGSLGVDEYGRAYLRGAPTGFLSTVPPVVLVGAALAAVAMVVVLLKK